MLWKAATLISGLAAGSAWAQPAEIVKPSSLPHIANVEERFQSYNIEMLEVTGGRFWKPYSGRWKTAPQREVPEPTAWDTPVGTNPELYEYRAPIDLANDRLRKLAAALAPAYVRVSGTWANATYFPESEPAPATAPLGFNSVLTHQRWRSVIEFARAVDAKIVTSFATSPGARNSSGAWIADQAARFIRYTSSVGGSIAAAEFMNEPTLATMGGAPPGYDAAAYGRDFKTFHAFARQAVPDMLILGPGSVGEADAASRPSSDTSGLLNTRDMLLESGRGVDRFSYHYYGALSQRCVSMGNQTTREAAMSEDWLQRTEQTLVFYRKLRDQFEPGKPLWLTETADAACGGNPWAATFRDSFRYLDQLGRLAKQGVQVVAHNTLAASDYGLLDEHSFMPRPNYWSALLWRKLMGGKVLDAGIATAAGIHVYAHCLRAVAGGVALLAINTDQLASHSINVAAPSEQYTLTSGELDSLTVALNGVELKLSANDELPSLTGVARPPGPVTLTPASITFLAIPNAGNDGCT